VEDSARGIVAAGVAPRAVGATINIGSGHEITVNELARLVGEVTGTGLSPEYHPGRPGDVLRLYSDSRRATDLLGWTPQVSLREGLEKLVAWHDEQGTDWSRALTEDVPHNWEVDA
jgi:UDP-glucose 4-epimerase